jgi:hypothetical protein
MYITMQIKKLTKKADLFYRLAAGKDGLEAILKKLSELETFTDRVDYAEEQLEHFSSGSSRVIYLTPDKTVLKLAKNNRGIAQNKVEANPKMASKYINETLKADKKGYWKISPFLDKITEKEFEKMTGVDFKDFGEAMSYGLKTISEDSSAKKPKNFDKVKKLEIYQELVKLGKKFELLPGDIERISSWGKVDDHPVLLDAGLTRDIYDEFYESS